MRLYLLPFTWDKGGYIMQFPQPTSPLPHVPLCFLLHFFCEFMVCGGHFIHYFLIKKIKIKNNVNNACVFSEQKKKMPLVCVLYSGLSLLLIVHIFKVTKHERLRVIL